MKDEIVPRDHSKRLFEAATGAQFKRMYECEQGDHNNTWMQGGEDYISAFKNFFVAAEEATKNE